MGKGQRPQLWEPLRLASSLPDVWIVRYLEEGNIQAAEAQKRRIEQLQRDRRRVMEENNIVHQARFFRCLIPRPPCPLLWVPLQPSSSLPPSA